MGKRVGLVLAGGGAKGAYQIGVWRALQERGIKFDFISGTSIGALNGALIVNQNYQRAIDFWYGLSTYAVGCPGWSLLAVLVMRLIGILVNIEDMDRGVPGWWAQFPTSSLTLLLMVFAAMWFGYWEWSPLLLGALMLIFFLRLLPFLAHKLNMGGLSLQRLRDFVRKAIDIEMVLKSPTPLFVTVASQHSRSRFYPYVSPPWRSSTPDYVKVNDLTEKQVEPTLVTSMALPFGLFPHVKLGEGEYFDGELADNTPLYPLIREGCEEIYVVHLAPKGREKEYRLTEKSNLFMRLCDINIVRRDAGFRDLLPPDWTSGAVDLRAKVVHIVPSRSLGWPIISTLYFSRRKTERLIWQGYEDAVRTLNTPADAPPANSSYRKEAKSHSAGSGARIPARSCKLARARISTNTGARGGRGRGLHYDNV